MGTWMGILGRAWGSSGKGSNPVGISRLSSVNVLLLFLRRCVRLGMVAPRFSTYLVSFRRVRISLGSRSASSRRWVASSNHFDASSNHFDASSDLFDASSDLFGASSDHFGASSDLFGASSGAFTVSSGTKAGHYGTRGQNGATADLKDGSDWSRCGARRCGLRMERVKEEMDGLPDGERSGSSGICLRDCSTKTNKRKG